MKNFAKVMIAAGFALGAMGVAQADTKLVAADEAVTSDICVVAAKGNKIKLHRAIKDAGLSRDFVAKNVSCNDLPIVEFVEQYGENVASINRYITAGEYTGELISLNAS